MCNKAKSFFLLFESVMVGNVTGTNRETPSTNELTLVFVFVYLLVRKDTRFSYSTMRRGMCGFDRENWEKTIDVSMDMISQTDRQTVSSMRGWLAVMHFLSSLLHAPVYTIFYVNTREHH